MANWDVKTANSSLDFDTRSSSYHSCAKIDTNHFINFWRGVNGILDSCQVFTVNTTTFEVTTSGSVFTFDTTQAIYNSVSILDVNHCILFNVEQNSGYSRGQVQVFTVNTTNWEVTTGGSILNYGNNNGNYSSCAKIDTNHFINFFQGVDEDGFVQVFTVNTTTFEVTTANSSLEFDTQSATWNSCYQIDANHFINFWGNTTGSEAYAQAFAVNTSTWAVTTAGSSVKYFTDDISANSCYKIDDTHFINFWRDAASIDGEAQIFVVNTSTWAVTTAGAAFTFDEGNGLYNSCQQIDSNHFINFYGGTDADGFAVVVAVNTSTWAITTAAAALEFDTDAGLYHSCAKIDTNHFINFWRGVNGNGFAQTFTVELGASGPANLKTLNTNTKSNIKTINTATIANTKTWDTVT